MAKRDIINWQSRQRVDAGEQITQQRNALTNVRSGWEDILFSLNANAKQKIMGGFNVTAQSPVSSKVDISNGIALGAERLDDNTIERIVTFGGDTATTKSLDFSALGAATYTVWVRFSFDPGESGTRVFYNPDTNEEESKTIDTTRVHDWDVSISALSPGDEWLKLADVVWGGSTIATGNITEKRDLFFEGDEGNAFAHEWGDGGNDRNTDRGEHGIKNIWRWIHAMRRQMEEIFDSALGTKWFLVPVSNLKEVRAHIDLPLNPHGTTLTQTTALITTCRRPVTVTRTLHIIAGAFHNNDVPGSTGPGILAGTGASYKSRHFVGLPKDATITEIIVHGNSGDATGNDLSFGMARVLSNSESESEMAGNTAGETSFQNDIASGAFSISDSSITNPIIDNDTFSYYVWIHANILGGNSGLTLYSFEIKYTVLNYE